MDEYIRDDILDNEAMRKIYVNKIPAEADDAELKTFFENLAKGTVIESLSVVRKDTSKKFLFGFVTFETSEQVDEVLLKKESLNFKGKVLEITRAIPKTDTWEGAHEKTKKLFIANLPISTGEKELTEYFVARHPQKYGTIESIQLIKKKDDQGNKTEVNKGYGFIFVSSEDMADKMAIQHNTFTFGGRKIELKKNVETGRNGDGGGRGRGRGRGGDKGMRGGRGGGQYQGYGGGYEASYGNQWAADQYNAGFNAGYGGGYGGDYGGGYGGGYGANNRFQPY